MAAVAAAAALPAGAAAAPPPPAPAAAAAARRTWTRLSARVALATALFVLGCAAAALAFFAMTIPSADARLLGSCVATDDAAAAGLRAASEKLLLAASAQVLAATTALLVPARPAAFMGCVLGWYTAYHAAEVLLMLVACQDDHAAFHYCAFLIMLGQALIVGLIVSCR